MAKSGFIDRNLMKVNPLKEQFEPTVDQPIRQRARMGGDPVHSVAGGGEQWGNHGKVYHGADAKAKAAKQGAAAYANGYKGK